MGAAVAKAVDEIADARRTQAESRLAVAEQLMLRWRPSTVAGTGIWDADAVCVNRGLLSALDDIVLLKEIHAFPMASPARSRMDAALGVAMSRLMEEFLLLRVWDASGLQGLTGIRFERQHLSTSVSLAFQTDGSNSTELSSLCTSDALSVSVGSRWSRHDMVAPFVDDTFLDGLDLIRRESLPVLHEISLRVIRAGYTGELLRTFHKTTCDVLDRFLPILQVEQRSLEADHEISFEDAEWWTAEDMIKRWILASKLMRKALFVMQRQLQAQILGAFERFKNDYFLAIAKQSIFVLLKVADGFTSIRSPEKLIYILEMYEALSNAAPDILLLFTGLGEHAELQQVAEVLAKLARALRVAIGGLITNIQTECSQAENAIRSVGVHPLTRYAMACVEVLGPHRTALDLILAEGDGGAGDTARVTTFSGLVTELIEGLERNLEEKSALVCAEATGSAHLFMANNMSFVLNRAADADVSSLLGDEWFARRLIQLERDAASCVEATWGPVVACLEIGNGKAAKALEKFNTALKEAHHSQACGEVPDPALRAALRKTVSGMVVPAYSAFVQKHPKLEKSVSYTPDDLAEWLWELFEGEVAPQRTF